MKVIEHIKDNRTGEIAESSWGDDIDSDLAIITSVANILQHQHDRESGNLHAFQGRFTTVKITIEL